MINYINSTLIKLNSPQENIGQIKETINDKNTTQSNKDQMNY